MNMLDKIVGAISPQSGEARLRARARMRVLMNYDAASKGRRTYGWKAPGTDADAAAFGARERLRNLSRDMIRNRAIAERAQSVVAGNVVGTGIKFSVEADQPHKDQVDEVLGEFLGTTAIDAYGVSNFAGLQRVVINSVFSDGEVLVRLRARDPRFSAGLGLPFQLQLMEADYLNTSITSHGKNVVIEGVEIGPTGRIEAYHLYREHPGSVAMVRRNKLETERVPANRILHIFRQDRPGQLRGVPWLAPVMMTLGEVSDYQEAQILKQRMSALLAAVVTSEDDSKPFDGAGIEELAPGALVGLRSGQSIEFSNPPKVEGYEQFMKQVLAMIASGVGITYEALSGDLSNTNYTSFRAGRIEMDRNVEAWQQMVMVAGFCAGVGRWIRDYWDLSQHARDVRSADFKLNWTPPVRAMVEPSREVVGVERAIKAGLVSRQRAIRRLGEDPETIRREREEDAAQDAAMPHATPENEDKA